VNKIFLDYNSTTPVSKEVLEAMLPYFSGKYGNPSSVHSFGQDALHAVNKARLQVAGLIGASVDEIIFTGGGTESNNFAISGITRLKKEGKNHIITSSVEHSSVYNLCRQLEEEGYEVTYLPVDKQGRISIADLENSITDKTAVISVILANNETGTIQNIKEIAKIATERYIPTHTDAVQAVSKIPVSVEELGVDLLSLSGHKIYGPKGIGALFAARGLHLHPLLWGGGQESKKRSGTENVPGIVGLGAACELAGKDFDNNIKNLCSKRNRLEQGILSNIPFAKVNGGSAERAPNTANISFSGMESETLLIKLDFNGIAVSSGSACGAASKSASGTLTAMGLPRKELYSSLRFSIGKHTTDEEIDHTVKTLMKICKK
jgi:cysteine desulfurase